MDFVITNSDVCVVCSHDLVNRGNFHDTCEMLDNVCDIKEVYFLGDLNIDWLSSSCPLKKKILTVTSAYNLAIGQPTRVVTNFTGMK